jgi:hypothetical protein
MGGILSCCIAIFANPFLLDIPESKDESDAYILYLQENMRKKDIRDVLDLIYPKTAFFGKDLKPFDDFYRRSMRGLKQTLIDPDRELYPKKEHIVLNGGGDNCIVLSCPLNHVYPELLTSLIRALEDLGFKGGLYFRMGGIANPTGKEVRYVGVPYSFKIFMMMEAFDLGYKNVLWLDSSVFPLKDLSPLFESIQENGSLVCFKRFRKNSILPQTQRILREKTGYEPSFFSHVSMQVFGLSSSCPWKEAFIQDYYEMVELGTPFFSCYPEEHVISALIYKHAAILKRTDRVILPSKEDNFDFVEARKKGYYFFLRRH